ncbi:MAG: hypothetical protein R2684_13540 [Pyrinomonadaceae bacterium]
MLIRFTVLLFIGLVLLANSTIYGQGELGYIGREQAEDFLVDQGLSVLGRNEVGMDYAHALRQLGLKPLRYRDERERFKLAVEKFQFALVNEKLLKAYKPIQVRSYLAVAYCRLAFAYEASASSGVQYDLDARIAYGACFAEYERVIKGTPTILTSLQTEWYVAAIIKSGNFEQAIAKIKEIQQLKWARAVSTRKLLYYEGDAYFKLGEKYKSGAAYDKWLQGETETLGISDEVQSRLRELHDEVGLPTLKSLALLNNRR